MKIHSYIYTLIAAGAMLTLAGCATYPVSKELRKQANPATLAQVLATPGTYHGKLVIWGGKIIQTVNDTNGADLYVLKFPLNHYERPRGYENPTGRFIAHTSGFLDPAVYKNGRLVTVAGTISGQHIEPLQKIKYTYLVLSVKQLHLWPVEQRLYYYPAWGWGAYYPGWWGYYPAWGVGWGWYYPGGGWDEDYPGDWR